MSDSPDQSRTPAAPMCSVCRHPAPDGDPCIHCAPLPPDQMTAPSGEQAEVERWKANAKKERECSLVIEGENERLRSELATLRIELDFLRPALDQAKLSSELIHGEHDRLRAALAQRDQIEHGLREEVIRLQADYDVARDEIMRLRGQVDNCQANAHYRAWQESQAELQQARALVEQVTENAARLLMNGCEQHSGATFDEWLKAGAAQCPLCTNAVVEAARTFHDTAEMATGQVGHPFWVHRRRLGEALDQSRAPGE